jgi:hypothetical protein
MMNDGFLVGFSLKRKKRKETGKERSHENKVKGKKRKERKKPPTKKETASSPPLIGAFT